MGPVFRRKTFEGDPKSLLGHPPLFIQVGTQKCDTRKLYSVPPDKPYMRGQASVLSVSMFTI